MSLQTKETFDMLTEDAMNLLDHGEYSKCLFKWPHWFFKLENLKGKLYVLWLFYDLMFLDVYDEAKETFQREAGKLFIQISCGKEHSVLPSPWH
mgnify:CR=1 FL=1